MSERDFLIAHDYGMGGTWAKVKAENPEDVTSAYPCFEIVAEKPDWMTGVVETNILTTGLNDPTLKAICVDKEVNRSPFE